MNELLALEANRTWELIPLPSNPSVIRSKWVYSIKVNSYGSLDHYKARLVVQGYNQEFGDEDSVLNSVRFLRDLSVQRDLQYCAISHPGGDVSAFGARSPSGAIFVRCFISSVVTRSTVLTTAIRHDLFSYLLPNHLLPDPLQRAFRRRSSVVPIFFGKSSVVYRTSPSAAIFSSGSDLHHINLSASLLIDLA